MKTNDSGAAADATTTTTADADAIFNSAVTAIESGSTPTQEALADAGAAAADEAAAAAAAATTDAAKTETDKAADAAKAATAQAATEAKAATDAADADLAKLPAEARAIVDRIKAEAAKEIAAANQTAARHQGQVGGYEKKLREARAELDAAKKTQDPAAIAKAKADEKAASDALSKVKNDYPEIASAMESIEAKVLEKVRRELGSELGKLQKTVEPLVKGHATSLETAEVAAIEAAHPGWEKEIETDQFQTWWAKQGQGVQALAKGGADDEIALFNLYRSAHPLQDAAAIQKAAEQRAAADALAARRSKQQQDAAGPSGRRTQAPSQTADTASPEAMFNRAVAAIEKGMTPTP